MFEAAAVSAQSIELGAELAVVVPAAEAATATPNGLECAIEGAILDPQPEKEAQASFERIQRPQSDDDADEATTSDNQVDDGRGIQEA